MAPGSSWLIGIWGKPGVKFFFLMKTVRWPSQKNNWICFVLTIGLLAAMTDYVAAAKVMWEHGSLTLAAKEFVARYRK